MSIFEIVSISLLVLTIWLIVFSGVLAEILNHKAKKKKYEAGMWMITVTGYGCLTIWLWWLLYFTVWFIKENFS